MKSYPKAKQTAKKKPKSKVCSSCNKKRKIADFSTPKARKCDFCKRQDKRVKKRSSKSYITKQLDKELRVKILERDKVCQRCSSTKTLQASHVYTKKAHPELRHDPMNIKLLCRGCHIYWWHREIREANDWFEAKFPERAEYLRGKIRGEK